MTIVTRARSRPAATQPLRNITTAIEQQLGYIEQWSSTTCADTSVMPGLTPSGR